MAVSIESKLRAKTFVLLATESTLTENEGDIVWTRFEIFPSEARVTSLLHACGIDQVEMSVPDARARFAEMLGLGFVRDSNV